MLTLKVAGQIIKPVCCDTLVSDSLNILEIQFVFDAAWEGLAKTAQFTQVNKDGSTGETFDVLLDEFGTVMLPNEIHQGVVNISVFGVKDNRRLTTAPLAVPVVESGFIGKTLLIPTPEIYMQIMNTIAPNKAAYDAMTAELQKAILNAYQKTQTAVNEADARLEAIIQAAGDLDGDAELLDIRRGEDGASYSTAGTAVREQFRKQREELIRKLTTPFSITGAVAACHPVGGYPLEVISHLEPMQAGSGEPNPDNVRPIIGWTGANLNLTGKNLLGGKYLAEILQNKAKATIDESIGTVTFNAENIADVDLLHPKVFKPQTQYTIILYGKNNNSGRANSNIRITYADGSRKDINFDASNPDIDGYAFVTTEAGKTVARLSGAWMTGSTTLFYDKCCFVEGFTSTDEMEKCMGSQYTAQFGQTIYGGEHYWKTGKLTKAIHGIAFTGSETFAREKWCDYGYEPVISTAILEKRANYVNTNSSKVLTNNTHFTNLGTTQIVSGKYGNGVGIYGESTWTKIFFRVPRSVYGATTSNTDAELLTLWKNWLAAQSAAGTPLTVVYDLYTPEEIQLTPQQILSLDGVNNLWSDCGKTTVNGPNSPKVMENRIAALEAAILNA